ncbi:DNA-binding transcriptional response regulator, NtrC family, contains REC, AAA-type ATPase, and a Fis-type DNA-binding domains [Limimonas halophila]|uniref:DNA-binding transcriptional response regulator, NtrC family, contains REC, AAA-type ATPase, and a Fis-type DNA-binding domains n=2 Tax=Limimonas halophila TaxID=1082479 RepID=A0A1G7QYY5_9PROT|nr:DNA-binding transcriptional response regulator, NtrC family, contains REC, AAA-type ATPase, and a Fis-type DNA-binding domains [Limimonas halophila]
MDRLADLVLTVVHEHPAVLTTVEAHLAAATAGSGAADAHAAPDGPEDAHMVGSGPAMRQVFDTIRRCARCDAPVLVTGESGTGKELAALAIHERSAAAEGPFVAVNCGGLPSELVSAELFGHEKGAFTGAVSQRIGRVEEANGGTLFLDEIGDLPLDLQAHLLRFLQNGVIQRVGGNSSIRVDCRVVAATNVDLERAVAEGRFREDLFYRLDVLRICIPALRERPEDIPQLARYFTDRLAREMQLGERHLAPDAVDALMQHTWPGNVRELISTLRRALVMADAQTLHAEDIQPYWNGTGNGGGRSLGAPGHAAASGNGVAAGADGPPPTDEAACLQAALAETGGNVTRTAERLGVSRVTVYKLMRRHNVSRAGAMNGS